VFFSTYFPKDHFMHILRNLAGAWKMNRSKLLRVADELNTHLNDNSTRYLQTSSHNRSAVYTRLTDVHQAVWQGPDPAR